MKRILLFITLVFMLLAGSCVNVDSVKIESLTNELAQLNKNMEGFKDFEDSIKELSKVAGDIPNMKEDIKNLTESIDALSKTLAEMWTEIKKAGGMK